MSSPARRRELAVEQEAKERAREIERHRKENLSMYARIEEADCDETVKDILRRIAEHAGVDLWS